MLFRHLLRSVPTTTGKVEEMMPTVDERQIVEVFKGIRIGDKSIFSLASNPRHMEALFRRGCYVRFNKDSSVLFDANAYSSVVGFLQVKAAPRLEEYILSHLKAKGQLADWEKFKRLAVLRWDPPSLLLRLVDSFVRQILQNRPRAEADEWVSRLCEALFQPFGKCQGFEQKKAVLKWLRAYLSSESQHSVIPQKKSHDDSTNYRVYKELVNGRTDAAVGQAKRAGMFHLATLAQAAVRSPLVPAMRQPMINQVVKGKDVYERKIHLLLSGDVESDDIERVAPAVEGLNWLQALNVIIGHWARQSVGLDRCVDRLDALIHRGFVKID